jgi:hypothetical protein
VVGGSGDRAPMTEVYCQGRLCLGLRWHNHPGDEVLSGGLACDLTLEACRVGR